MNILATVNMGIAAAIKAAGDAIVSVVVAGSQALEAVPGEDYDPTWNFYGGKGFWEQAESADFPGTQIQVNDKVIVLLQCQYDVEDHDLILVDGDVYHVHGVKFDVVGSTRVLQKLLVRAEKRGGIPWPESAALLAA